MSHIMHCCWVVKPVISIAALLQVHLSQTVFVLEAAQKWGPNTRDSVFFEKECHHHIYVHNKKEKESMATFVNTQRLKKNMKF